MTKQVNKTQSLRNGEGSRKTSNVRKHSADFGPFPHPVTNATPKQDTTR